MSGIVLLYFIGLTPMGWYYVRKRVNHPVLSTLFWPLVGAFLLLAVLISRQDLNRSSRAMPATPDAKPVARYGTIEPSDDV